MQNVSKLKSEIEKIISNSYAETDLNHARSTRKWLLELKPNADLALRISALGHDIERGFESDRHDRAKEKFDDYVKYKHNHSKKSAEIIVRLLDKYDFGEDFISKVNHLVLNHEFGGDKESDLLMDADSISFFEENLTYYFQKCGEEKTRKKIRFMYDRMSNKAKEIIRAFEYKDSKLTGIIKEEILK